METAKLWSVSGTLRGFYDDNYNTQPSGTFKRSSFGFEFSPYVSLNVPLQQTELGLRYTYGLYYYQARNRNSSTAAPCCGPREITFTILAQSRSTPNGPRSWARLSVTKTTSLTTKTAAVLQLLPALPGC